MTISVYIENQRISEGKILTCDNRTPCGRMPPATDSWNIKDLYKIPVVGP